MLQCMAKFQKKVEPLPTKRYSTIIRFIAILKQSNNQMVLGQLPQKKTNPYPNPNLGTIIFEDSCPDTQSKNSAYNFFENFAINVQKNVSFKIEYCK